MRHPSTTASQGATLRGFHGEGPEPVPVRRKLTALDIDVPVEGGEHTRLTVTIAGHYGEAMLEWVATILELDVVYIPR